MFPSVISWIYGISDMVEHLSLCEATGLEKKMSECSDAESKYKDFLARANLK